MDYKDKKVMTIGMVSELTELTERQIRYYESRKLISPERTPKGTRRYSFVDVETLIDISEKVGNGIQTFAIKNEMKRQNSEDLRNELLQGQLNAFFGNRRR